MTLASYTTYGYDKYLNHDDDEYNELSTDWWTKPGEYDTLWSQCHALLLEKQIETDFKYKSNCTNVLFLVHCGNAIVITVKW